MRTVDRRRDAIRFMPVLAWALTIATSLVSCADAQIGLSQSVQSRLTGALRPDSGESVVFSPPREAAVLPGAVFYSARLDPPLAAGLEDDRPLFVTAVSVRDSVLLIARLANLSTAWALIQPPVPTDPDSVVQLVVEFGDISGRVRRANILASRAEALDRFGDPALLDSPEALDSLRAPAVAATSGGWEVKVYAMTPSTISEIRYDIGANSLSVHQRVIARFKLSM
jgi:hypothetical protein